ncbi:MAG: histidine phosphatase family protein [Pseudomonadota bacterium]
MATPLTPGIEFHLVRHGETDWNAEGRVQGQAESRLTARGKTQASAVGATLDLDQFDAIYCSSSVRTRQTLDGLLAGSVRVARFRDDLREMYLGPWQGLLRTDVIAQWPTAFDDFLKRPDRFTLDGAESFDQLQARGCAALDAIAAEAPGRRVLVVSHGALIKSVYCRAAGLSLALLWAPPTADNCARFVVSRDPDGQLAFLDHVAGGDALTSNS